MINFLDDELDVWNQIINFLQNGEAQTSPILYWAIIIVAGLIVIVSIFSLLVSLYLAVKYIRFNRRKNSLGLAGKDIARKVLDDNGLQNIKVSATGSILFGNSYSHYFHKVRLRRLTWKKDSVSSLAMAVQKSSLAIMDKEGDPDMKKRNKLIPLITFGPFAFVPLVIIGVLLDVFIFTSNNAQMGVCTAACCIIGLLFYVFAFVLSLVVYRVEIKGQKRAYEICKEKGYATAEELEMMKELFRLYNIQYVNDMIMAMLELIYRVLKLVIYFTSKSNVSSNK